MAKTHVMKKSQQSKMCPISPFLLWLKLCVFFLQSLCFIVYLQCLTPIKPLHTVL